MAYTHSLTRRIRERNSVVNVDINTQIKALQRKLVSINFSNDNNSTEYFDILRKIKKLRSDIFNEKRA